MCCANMTESTKTYIMGQLAQLFLHGFGIEHAYTFWKRVGQEFEGGAKLQCKPFEAGAGDKESGRHP